MREYVGHLHIHSTYSDGHKTIEEIAEIARRSDVDFLGFNDHNTLQGLHDGKEGWYGDVLVLVGTEVGGQYHHYLGYDVTENVPENTEHPQEVIDDVNRQGGLGFIAHPFERGSPVDGGHAITWDDWSVTGYTGICIWNYSSAWKENARNIPMALYYFYLRRRAARIDPSEVTLQTWDRECQRRRVVAVGGGDNHGLVFRLFNSDIIKGEVFPYEYAFTTVNTHILLRSELKKEFVEDKTAVYGALRRGNCFVANGLLGSARGFRFFAEGRGAETMMGDEVLLEDGLRLVARSPGQAHIRLIKDGGLAHEARGSELTLNIEQPGVYRVELFRRSFLGGRRAWVFSNPIYVRS